MLTSFMARLSYARFLVEIDLRKKLRDSVNICLPNGEMIEQQIVYETLPKFCSYCKVLGHMVKTCSKYAKSCSKDKGNAANVHGKELQQGAANAQGMGLQQGERLGDPMLAEAATAGGEWETMKRKQKSNRHHKKITAASVGAAAATGVGAKIAPASGVVAVVAGADSCVAAGAAIAGAVAAKHALTVALN
ncbi:hypothetical protein OIU76_002024 [Salix suchowensis]|nr:hypothetical protein OIU76_002024 [Salix suchowensis]